MESMTTDHGVWRLTLTAYRADVSKFMEKFTDHELAIANLFITIQK